MSKRVTSVRPEILHRLLSDFTLPVKTEVNSLSGKKRQRSPRQSKLGEETGSPEETKRAKSTLNLSSPESDSDSHTPTKLSPRSYSQNSILSSAPSPPSPLASVKIPDFTTQTLAQSFTWLAEQLILSRKNDAEREERLNKVVTDGLKEVNEKIGRINTKVNFLAGKHDKIEKKIKKLGNADSNVASLEEHPVIAQILNRVSELEKPLPNHAEDPRLREEINRISATLDSQISFIRRNNVIISGFETASPDVIEKANHFLATTFKLQPTCGDFNCRIADLDKFVDQELIRASMLSSYRISRDQGTPSHKIKRKMLLEFILDNGFVLMNGRSPGDEEGNFTFCGAQGLSTVDLVWGNQQAIRIVHSMTINDFSFNSDHFPVSASVKFRGYSGRPTWNNQPEIVDSSGNSELLNTCIIEAAAHAGMTSARNTAALPGIQPRRKPWEDSEYRVKKATMNKSQRLLRRSSYMDADLIAQFHLNILEYRNCRRNKIKIHTRAIRDKIANVKNSAVLEHNVTHTDLDQNIELAEVKLAIKYSKPGKAPGPYGITNEFLKNLTESHIVFLTSILNQAWNTGVVPEEWSGAAISMLFKKRNADDPGNYRGIALINNSLELLTGIVQKRLETWMESCRLLPEEQAGFRSGRGCLDQTFTLHAAI
ncbi:uncharacterized protein LOC107043507 [Diachasma alloeum]|uniref:uncharacterized protein LOC107043507 n=1 Tax=Diachasma alloeum TaxID=454923 RepID=UPI0007382240|nr:uncharacterized protein LOC107043507 [Diachasma alloeum]